jgi:hypothetical protein
MIGMVQAVLLAAAMALFGVANTALANTLFTFVGDCSNATCFGSTYTLVVGDANDSVNTTYTATLTINTSEYNGPISPAFIDAVDIKIVNNLLSAPVLSSAPGGEDNWQVSFNNGQAATDCGSGGGFFICARDPDPNNLAPVGGTLIWDWSFSSNDKIKFGHVGASYNDAAGTIEGNNTSISNATTGGPGTPVPEPSTLILLGSGLVILVGVARRNYGRTKR